MEAKSSSRVLQGEDGAETLGPWCPTPSISPSARLGPSLPPSAELRGSMETAQGALPQPSPCVHQGSWGIFFCASLRALHQDVWDTAGPHLTGPAY